MIVARAVGAAMCGRRYAFCGCRALHTLNHVNQSPFSVSAKLLENQPDQIYECNEALPFHFLPFASDSVASILKTVKTRYLHEVICVQLLKALRVQVLLKKEALANFQDDHGFEMLHKAFANSCDKLEPSMLVSGLRSLLIIGLDPSSSTIEKAEKTILANIQVFQTIDVISCLHLHSKNLKTSLQKAVAASLVEEMQRRNFEIQTGSEALMLVQLLKFFRKDEIQAIEKKIADLLDLIDQQDVVKCFFYLSEQKVRAKFLLKKLCSRLCFANKPSLKDSVNIMFSILSLNYFNQELLLFLTDARTNDIIETKQPSLISSLLIVCGQLRWRHSEILEACCQWFKNKSSLCSPKDSTSLLLTLATLCYVPEDKSLLENFISSLKLEDVEAKTYLDAVWASAILDCVNKNVLLDVVSSDFHQKLLDSSDGVLPVQARIKMMNLMAVLKNTYPECIFSCDLFLDMDGVSRSEKSVMHKESVLSSLKSFIPEGRYLATNLNTSMGITIDAEFIIGKDEKPLLLTEYGLKAKPSVVTKSLPPGSKRIALMIWLHKDLTLNKSVLTGANALAVKLLSMEGYTVVQVPYEMFSRNATAVLKVKYLWQLIQSHLGK